MESAIQPQSSNRPRRPVWLIAIAALLPTACSGESEPSPYPLDDVLRLNHVQAKGTHNSYHLAPAKPLDPSHAYTHAPLAQQLSEQGVRQLEFDLHYRKDVGFEVFHLPGIDAGTTCQRLVDCLKAVAAWSDAHRWHLPLLLWLEPKDDIDGPIADLLPLTGRWDLLEAELRSVFARDRIFTPDQLRGTHPNLPAAIASDGWPTLGQLRGKLLFALLDSGAHRDDYLGSAQNLQGRLLFVASSTAEDPFAALFKINDAQREADRVRQLVQRGFIVTSNVDDVGGDDATNAAKLAASLAAGIHFGSSDRPAKLADRDYFFDLPDGNPARCNPVFPAARCSASDIEALSVP